MDWKFLGDLIIWLLLAVIGSHLVALILALIDSIKDWINEWKETQQRIIKNELYEKMDNYLTGKHKLYEASAKYDKATSMEQAFYKGKAEAVLQIQMYVAYDCNNDYDLDRIKAYVDKQMDAGLMPVLGDETKWPGPWYDIIQKAIEERSAKAGKTISEGKN